MASNPPKPTPDIEALKKRHRQLDTQRIAAGANLKQASEQLEQLKKEARELYGTDDLRQLQDKLREMKLDNENKRVEYDKHLAEIEKELDRIEQDRPGPPKD